MRAVTVIGAGLAGPEAAWQVAAAGVAVRLYEMRPRRRTPAHQSDQFAELVCSNSLGSSLADRASGVLQAELEQLGSKLLELARACAVPAGQALAVDRTAFAAAVTQAVAGHPLIEVRREEVTTLPSEGVCVLASGPLTSEALAGAVARLAGTSNLSFFDAIAPVVSADSLDFTELYAASRYGHGEADYWNVPLDPERYRWLVAELLAAEKRAPAAFESADPRAARFFERCLPVEVLAARGAEALRFGPLRPVGLRDPRTGRRPYAVLQLRPENRARTLYNLVGFQTNLRHGEQERILRALPGFAAAEFVRLGSMHRNTFLRAPALLNATLEWRGRPGLFVAGQLTGMEGYLGNIGSGLLAGRNALRRALGAEPETLPRTTLLGALAAHVAEAPAATFQPMKAEFGLLPPLPDHAARARRNAVRAAHSASSLAEHLRLHPLPGAYAAV
ncbi:MAG: methylenetetrahydrofolate--tRNA-(uracil(54)-C(5))-methyltransferase (FADH(2)-oxidizing) TrmFO [Planctomycetota bacterium]|nr:MAG: methylenetetrahydrofolate--tRNA-(uracil(54)-C(5))-methyltransferase (FADH(2)-oxidizing) TrmFO [Planctomycetota bacterium]